MINLLSNALKYTHKGGRVDVVADLLDDNKIKIFVKDTGIGIKQEDQERIFEEFYRIDQPKDTIIGGTGIGLALTKRLVLMHNGQIGLDSQINQGSTFWIILPIDII